MAPIFNSQNEMISYFNGIRSNAFDVLLEDEFNIPVPIGAPKYQAEYLYKYLIQGMSFKHITGDELVKYAVERTENLVRELPHLILKGAVPDEIKTARKTTTGRVRVVKNKQPDGAVMFLEYRQVWVGYHGGKIQCSKKTEQAVRNFLVAKFGE